MIRNLSSKSGFTLVEVMVASTLTMIAAAAVFSSGVLSVRMSRSNVLNMQARLMADLYVEETLSGGLPAILAAMNEGTNTIDVGYGYSVDRWIEVVGHRADGATVSNILDSAYVEVHVSCQYPSVFDEERTMIETVSTLYTVP